MIKKKYIKYLGKIITGISLLFIIKSILSFDIGFKLLLKPNVFLTIVVLAIVLSSSVLLNSLAWKKLIEMLSSSELNILEIINIYAKSNVSKYLPGNVMHYASRNIIGSKYNIEQTNMFYSTILEIILKILSAFAIVIVFVRNELLFAIKQLGDTIYLNINTLVILVFLMIIPIIVLIYIKSKKMIDKKLKIQSLLFSFLIYTFIFFLNIFVFLAVSIFIVDCPIGNENIFYISGIYILAWLLGYLTPGSPGGIGIRESIMILMLSEIFNTDNIVFVSIIIRLITVLADLAAYFSNIILERKVGIINETNNTNSLL
ncbi:lysylphosphatidylglycerol synthase domain-containing protein [Thermohalobacter berrensis]|uniref:Uncharacterized protein n=1 Tax=Thermohalobacter berrensis TaxID=99594 RepID=A0A419T4H0_9FIRM|nr:lysylphosphatidylglycerol synthase domain-containing protein [Thermohalobacter berrensis]RKD32278.1 hypothetical protein BET03_02905 [Thermohalobacter berrensis]